MILQHAAQTGVRIALATALVAMLAACGGGGLFGPSGAMPTDEQLASKERADAQRAAYAAATADERPRSTVWDLFTNVDDPNTTVEVNRYIWQASLEVLSFLPVEAVDPFTGVITTGFGRPPGGGRAYRATVYVQDPALDARSLKVALQGQGGAAVAPETVRAIEDAILTRARQLRIRDSRL